METNLKSLIDRMPNKESLLSAAEGRDLSKVVDHFMYWLLTNEDGVKKHGASREDVATAIDEVAQLYKRRLSGDEPEIEEWNAAADAAYSAAADAVAAAAGAVWHNAAAAADAAWRAAAAADAYSATDADVVDAVFREQECSRMSEKLLEIIQNAPLASTVYHV